MEYLFAKPMAVRRCVQETSLNLNKLIIFAISFGAASGTEITHFTFNTDKIMLS